MLEPQLREYISQQLAWAQQKPRDASRHAALGMVYAVNGLWAIARQAFQSAAQLDPNDPLSAMYLGVAAQELGETEEATTVFGNLTKRFPDFAPGFYRLGNALLRSGNLDEAKNAFVRLTELAPREWRGWAGLGEILLRQGQYAEAAQRLEKAVDLDRAAKNAHSLLGQAYRSLGRVEDAEIELNLGRNAINFPMPDDWSKDASRHMKLLQDQNQLANDYCEEGQPLKAVEVLAKAWSYYPDNISLINQLAITLNRSQQPNKARLIVRRALEKDQNYVPALITAALIEGQLGQNEQALATAERAIALAPKLAQPHIAKANALLGLERDQEALAALEAARAADPQNSEIHLEIGDVLWRNLNRPREAKPQYEAARQLDAVSVRAHMRLAELHAQLGETGEAKKVLGRLRRIAPNHPALDAFERKLEKPK